MDSFHAENETAVFYTMKCRGLVEDQGVNTARGVGSQADILLLSKDTDCSIIAIIQPFLQGRKLVHHLGDSYWDIGALHESLIQEGMPLLVAISWEDATLHRLLAISTIGHTFVRW